MRRIAFNRVVLIQSLTVLVLLGAVALAAYTVWFKANLVQGSLAGLEPRYARLQ